MDAKRRAKIHFVGSRIVPAASFVLENSIRPGKQTTRENKWLSRPGSRLINRSQLPSPPYSLSLSRCLSLSPVLPARPTYFLSLFFLSLSIFFRLRSNANAPARAGHAGICESAF